MKEFLSADDEMADVLERISWVYHGNGDGYYYAPDIILALSRGGSFVANLVSEWYKTKPIYKTIIFATLSVHSYTDEDIGRHGEPIIGGCTYNLDAVRPDDNILICDDIFDSGDSLNVVAKYLMARGVKRQNIKIFVHTLKTNVWNRKENIIMPDYVCRESDSDWIHFADHELCNLTEEEKEAWYYKRYPRLRECI
jgi:hypoxanthine phosphoribosyltransferase